MAEAAGTSSTPTEAPASEAAPAATTTETPVETAPVEKPVEQVETKPVETKPAETEKPAEPEITFKIPEGMKLPTESEAKFKAFLKAKMADGKLNLSPQDFVDHYAEQAKDAHARWLAQVAAEDKAWEAESKRIFSKDQLAAAEVGVGFFANFDPAWRDFSKSMRNHPTFVNAMRVVGESLAEDRHLGVDSARPTPAKRQAKDILYPSKTN